MTEPTEDRAERALRDALRQHAEIPDFRPLPLSGGRPAAAARGVLRWLPAAAVVLLVAAVGIPAALSLLPGAAPMSAVPEGMRAPAGQSAAPQPAASDGSVAARLGWRWESYRVLSYQVPDYWGYAFAPASDWCTGGRTAEPSAAYVALAPERRVPTLIACGRALPPDRLQVFVTVRPVGDIDRGWDLPAGWQVTSTELAGYVLEVVHPDAFASVAAQVVATVRPIGEVDPNGCQATAGLGGRTSAARTSLCQYDLGPGRQLVASKALSRDEADYLRAVIGKAPLGSGPDDLTCQLAGDTDVIVRLVRGGKPVDLRVGYSGCRGNGVRAPGESRRLTAEVCKNVLQPPLMFTSGHGAAARLCLAIVPESDAPPSPTEAPSALPSPNR